MTVKLNRSAVPAPITRPPGGVAAPAPAAPTHPAVSRGWTAGTKPSASTNAAAAAARARSVGFSGLARKPDYPEPLTAKMRGYDVEKGIPQAQAGWVKQVLDECRLAPLHNDHRNGFNGQLKNAPVIDARALPAAVRKNWEGTVGLTPKDFAAEIKVNGQSAFVVFSKATGTADWEKGGGYQRVDIYDAKGANLASGSFTGRQASSPVGTRIGEQGGRMMNLPSFFSSSGWTGR